MSSIKRRPNFITVEGIDGVGKSSLVASISDYIEGLGLNVKVVRQNKDTPLGLKVRKFLSCDVATDVSDTTYAFLFCASINDVIEKIIQPAHLNGMVVISDRYTMSTRVYQRDSKHVSKVCDIIESQLLPDIVFVLDAPPSIVKSRISARNLGGDAMETVSDEVLNSRRKEFLRLSREYGPDVHRIDASMSQEEVAELVIDILDGYFS